MRITTRILILAAGVAFMAAPANSFAMGAFVKGGGTCAVVTVGGPIATTMGVKQAHAATTQKISASINQAARMLDTRLKNDDNAILDQLKRNATSEKELFKKLTQEMRDMTVASGAAEQKVRAEELFGDGWKIDSTCADPEVGGGAQTGKAAESQVSSEAYTRLKGHNDKGYQSAGPNSFLRKMQEKPSEEITGENFFPQGGTYTAEDVRKAHEMTEMVTNPNPTPTIPDDAKSSPEAQAFQVFSNLKEARIALPQKVFSDNLAAHSATIPLGDWAKDTYARMGGQGEPAGVVDGKISPSALLNMMVDMRFANPNWHADLASANEKWLLYEIASMNAARMEMERRQMVLLQQIALLLAQDQASKTSQEFDGALRDRYRKALNQQ